MKIVNALVTGIAEVVLCLAIAVFKILWLLASRTAHEIMESGKRHRALRSGW